MPASPSSVESVDSTRVVRARPRRRRRRIRLVDLLVVAMVGSLAAGFAYARRLGLFPEQPEPAPLVLQPAPTATATTSSTLNLPSVIAESTSTTAAPVETTLGITPLNVQERETELTTPRPTLPSTPQPFAVREASPLQPVQVLVVGDALADGIAKGLARSALPTGGIEVRSRTAATSGLARPETFDWPAQLASMVLPDDELVVIAVGLNDAQGLSRASSGTETPGSDEWLTEYQARIRRLIEGAGPRPVLLVGLPVVENPTRDRSLAPVRAALAAEAEQHVNVRFLNLYPITSDAGKYIKYFDLGDGRELLARSTDGEHFTDTGYDLVAAAASNAIWNRS